MKATEKQLFLALPKTRKHSLCIMSLISGVGWLFCCVFVSLCAHTDFGYMVKVNEGLHSRTRLALKVKANRIRNWWVSWMGCLANVYEVGYMCAAILTVWWRFNI